MKKQVKKRGFGLMALALSSLLSVIGGRMAMAQTADPEAEGNVKIWLNNTDTPTDDVLPQGGALPYQAHLEGAGKDMTVVLVISPLISTNSARRLSFSNTSTVSTITLTLKKDATSSPFTIYGISSSLDVGDGKIEAHKDTVTGDLKTTGAASVYWFESPHMFVLQGGTYQLDNPNAPTTYTANSPNCLLKGTTTIAASRCSYKWDARTRINGSWDCPKRPWWSECCYIRKSNAHRLVVRLTKWRYCRIPRSLF